MFWKQERAHHRVRAQATLGNRRLRAAVGGLRRHVQDMLRRVAQRHRFCTELRERVAADGQLNGLLDARVPLRARQVLGQTDRRLYWVVALAGIRATVMARALVFHGGPHDVCRAALGIKRAPQARVREATCSKVKSTNHTVFATSYFYGLHVTVARGGLGAIEAAYGE